MSNYNRAVEVKQVNPAGVLAPEGSTSEDATLDVSDGYVNTTTPRRISDFLIQEKSFLNDQAQLNSEILLPRPQYTPMSFSDLGLALGDNEQQRSCYLGSYGENPGLIKAGVNLNGNPDLSSPKKASNPSSTTKQSISTVYPPSNTIKLAQQEPQTSPEVKSYRGQDKSEEDQSESKKLKVTSIKRGTMQPISSIIGNSSGSSSAAASTSIPNNIVSNPAHSRLHGQTNTRATQSEIITNNHRNGDSSTNSTNLSATTSPEKYSLSEIRVMNSGFGDSMFAPLDKKTSASVPQSVGGSLESIKTPGESPIVKKKSFRPRLIADHNYVSTSSLASRASSLKSKDSNLSLDAKPELTSATSKTSLRDINEVQGAPLTNNTSQANSSTVNNVAANPPATVLSIPPATTNSSNNLNSNTRKKSSSSISLTNDNNNVHNTIHPQYVQTTVQLPVTTQTSSNSLWRSFGPKLLSSSQTDKRRAAETLYAAEQLKPMEIRVTSSVTEDYVFSGDLGQGTFSDVVQVHRKLKDNDVQPGTAENVDANSIGGQSGGNSIPQMPVSLTLQQGPGNGRPLSISSGHKIKLTDEFGQIYTVNEGHLSEPNSTRVSVAYLSSARNPDKEETIIPQQQQQLQRSLSQQQLQQNSSTSTSTSTHPNQQSTGSNNDRASNKSTRTSLARFSLGRKSINTVVNVAMGTSGASETVHSSRRSFHESQLQEKPEPGPNEEGTQYQSRASSAKSTTKGDSNSCGDIRLSQGDRSNGVQEDNSNSSSPYMNSTPPLPTTHTESVFTPLALKRFKSRFECLDEAMSLREIQALRIIPSHANIVKVFDILYEQKTGILSVVLEKMDSTLFDLIEKNHPAYSIYNNTSTDNFFFNNSVGNDASGHNQGSIMSKNQGGNLSRPFDNEFIQEIMYSLISAVGYIHTLGIIHRDIKPENILITRDKIKLSDFGSCKLPASATRLLKLSDLVQSTNSTVAPKKSKHITNQQQYVNQNHIHTVVSRPAPTRNDQPTSPARSPLTSPKFVSKTLSVDDVSAHSASGQGKTKNISPSSIELQRNKSRNEASFDSNSGSPQPTRQQNILSRLSYRSKGNSTLTSQSNSNLSDTGIGGQQDIVAGTSGDAQTPTMRPRRWTHALKLRSSGSNNNLTTYGVSNSNSNSKNLMTPSDSANMTHGGANNVSTSTLGSLIDGYSNDVPTTAGVGDEIDESSVVVEEADEELNADDSAIEQVPAPASTHLSAPGHSNSGSQTSHSSQSTNHGSYYKSLFARRALLRKKKKEENSKRDPNILTSRSNKSNGKSFSIGLLSLSMYKSSNDQNSSNLKNSANSAVSTGTISNAGVPGCKMCAQAASSSGVWLCGRSIGNYNSESGNSALGSPNELTGGLRSYSSTPNINNANGLAPSTSGASTTASVAGVNVNAPSSGPSSANTTMSRTKTEDITYYYFDSQMTEYVATRWYRPPETVLGVGYGFELDIWAIGCVFCECITGEPLLPGDSDVDMIDRMHKLLGTPNHQILTDILGCDSQLVCEIVNDESDSEVGSSSGHTQITPKIQFKQHKGITIRKALEKSITTTQDAILYKLTHSGNPPTATQSSSSESENKLAQLAKKQFITLNEAQLSLIEGLLEYNYKDRLGSLAALEHEYFRTSLTQSNQQ